MTVETGDGGAAVTARLRAVMVRAPLALAFVSQGHFVAVSEQFSHLFAYADDSELLGRAARKIHVSDSALVGIDERAALAFAGGRPLDEENEYVRADGSRFWGRLQATPLQWEAPAGESMWIIDDVTAARQLRMQPTWTAKHDALTELSNRREFERRVADHVGSRRHEPVSVMWIDVDKFTEISAGMGQEVAEHFLYSMGQMLVTKVRASDPVSRLEKDHFAVLLPDCDQHYAEIVAEKVRSSVAGFRLHWGLHRARVKASIGIVQLQPTLESVDAVLGAAALACAEAKAAGGDTVRVFISAGGYEQLAG